MVISPHSERTVQQWLTAEAPQNRSGVCNLTLKNRSISLRPRFTLQGDRVEHEPAVTPDEGSSDKKVENIQFIDSNLGDVIDNTTPISDSLDYDKLALANFLKRPVQIQSYTWTEATLFDETFNPWNDYFSNAVIKNKIENYAYVRCNLKLKIVINSSPFYYSLLGAFYEPMNILSPAPIVETATYDGYFVPLSQRPHIWMYPQSNQGGEMKLPFFYHKDFVDITDASDLTDMGQIWMTSPITLLNANSVAGGVVCVEFYYLAENF